jgi:hypothetical protein
MALVFFDLDLLLSDGSGRAIIIVIVRCGCVSCGCDRPETTKGVVRNPCEI